MYCANCRLSVSNNVIFCPNCGKSVKGDVVVKNLQQQQNGYPLANFTARWFPLLFEIILWFHLIVGIVSGGRIGSMFGSQYTILGVIIGGIFACIHVVLLGGLVSLFMQLVNNTSGKQ